MNTRATAFLRRPVPYAFVFKTPAVGCAFEPKFPPQTRLRKKYPWDALKCWTNLQSQRLRFLACVTCQALFIQVDAQLSRSAGTEPILGQHPQNRFAQHPVGTVATNPLCGNFLETTGITAVGAVNLVFELVSRKTNLVRVDHNHVVATIEVGSESRLIFPNQHARYCCGNTAQHLAGSINHKPFRTLRQRLRLAALWNIRPHALLTPHPIGTNENNIRWTGICQRGSTKPRSLASGPVAGTRPTGKLSDKS